MGCPFRNPTRRIIPIMKNDMTDRCLPSLSIFFCSGVFGVSYGENKNGFFLFCYDEIGLARYNV